MNGPSNITNLDLIASSLNDVLNQNTVRSQDELIEKIRRFADTMQLNQKGILNFYFPSIPEGFIKIELTNQITDRMSVVEEFGLIDIPTTRVAGLSTSQIGEESSGISISSQLDAKLAFINSPLCPIEITGKVKEIFANFAERLNLQATVFCAICAGSAIVYAGRQH